MTDAPAEPQPLEIVLYPDPFLRKRARELTPAEFKSGQADGWSLAELVERMRVTMYANEGVGLAGPQVGVGLRIFVADDSKDNTGFFAVFNPKLEELDGALNEEEGCLSIPDVRAKVKRAQTLVLRGLDVRGEAFEKNADELLARVCQHETDHLDGVLFIDKIGMMAMHRLHKKLDALKADYERLRKLRGKPGAK
jgi:peptide deformylase